MGYFFLKRWKNCCFLILFVIIMFYDGAVLGEKPVQAVIAREQKTDQKPKPEPGYAYFESLLDPKLIKPVQSMPPMVRQLCNMACAFGVASGLSYVTTTGIIFVARRYGGFGGRKKAKFGNLAAQLDQCIALFDAGHEQGGKVPVVADACRSQASASSVQDERKLNDLAMLAGVVVWIGSAIGVMMLLSKPRAAVYETGLQVLERILGEWSLHKPFVPEHFWSQVDALHKQYQEHDGCLELGQDQAEVLVKQMIMVCLEARGFQATL